MNLKKNLLKPFKEKPRFKLFSQKFFVIVMLGLIVGVFSVYFFLTKSVPVKAEWWNDNFHYRKRIVINNSGATVTNKKIKIEQDTASLISSGKLQNDCKDVRFTDNYGNLLTHQIGEVAPIAYDNYTSYVATNPPETTKSFNHTVNAGTDRALVVIVNAMRYQVGDSPTDITSITYDGVSLTKAIEVDEYTTNRNYVTSIWYLANPNTGTNTITVTTSNNVHEWIVGAMNFTGVDQTNMIGDTASDSTNATYSSLTANLMTTERNSMVVGGGINRAGWGTLSVDTGTQIFSLNSGDTGDTGANGAIGYFQTSLLGVNDFTISASGASNNYVQTVAAIELLPAKTALGDLCNNASTDFWAIMPEIISGDSVMYMYYGNPSASNTASSEIFSQTAFTPSSIGVASEIFGPAPIFEMKFDEGTGSTAYDSSSNANNGTISAATWATESQCVSGKCLNFDGVDDQVSIGDPPYARLDPTSALTISAWINPRSDGEGNSGRIISNVSDVELFVQLDDNQAVGLCARTSGVTDTCTNSDLIPLNQWTHIAVVYTDSNSRIFYINGHEVLANDSTNSLTNIAADKIIGDRVASDSSFDGFIDEVKVYPYALTDMQVKNEHNLGEATVPGSQGSALQLGALSTESDGKTPSNSQSRSYCVPGDTSTCNTPVLELKLDENTGTTATDTSGNGNNATLYNDTAWTPGAHGQGLKFDGVGDYAQTGDASAIDISGTSPVTMSAWVNLSQLPSSSNNVCPVMITETGNNSGVFDKGFRIKDDGAVSFYVYDGAAELTTSSAQITTNSWYYITGVFTGANDTSIYINGKLSGTGATAASTYNFTTPQLVTAFNNSGAVCNEDYNGAVDQVRVYDYARTPAQIAWEYNRGAPVSWYKLDECQGTAIHDSAIYGLDQAMGNDGVLSVIASGSYTSPGTCNSGVSTESWNAGTDGVYGAAMVFDGDTGEYINVGDPANGSLDFGTGDFSIATWVKFYTLGGTDFFIEKGTQGATGDPGYSLVKGSTDVLGFRLQDDVGSRLAQNSTYTLSNNVWYHVVWTFDRDSNATLYIDGKKIETMNISTENGSIDSSDPFTISRNGAMNGEVDDVRVYNYALTAEQVKVIMNNGAVNYR